MMEKRIVTLLACALLLACGGGGLETHEGVAEAMTSGMEEMATILEGIDSKEAADSAAADLEKLAEKMAKVNEAYQKLGDPDKEAEDALEKKYQERIMKAMQRVGTAAQTAGPYMAESQKCQEAFQRVGEKMENMK
jgi:hypothetical protein